MDKKQVLETLFDKKVIKVLRLFINNPENEYYLREIAKVTKVPPATTFRILGTMKDLELITERRQKHLKTYRLNPENTSMFSSLLEDKQSALQEFTEFIKTQPEVELAVLHGKEEKDKASVLIVGESMNQEAIRLKSVEIREKYGFNIIYLLLSSYQYDQMVNMGLYPGKKVILWSRPE